MKQKYPSVHGTVRLTLNINGHDYAVVPTGCVNGYVSYLLKKKGQPGTDVRYIVNVANPGISCTCPDFCRRTRQDLACKHIKALEKFYMLR
jgi:hypothetical protein